MGLFDLSKASLQEWRVSYRRTQAMGAVPLLFALFTISFVPGRSGPVIWGALGFAAGLHLILWGGYHLHLAHFPDSSRVIPQSRFTPFLLFTIFHLFGWTILVLLWNSLIRLGFSFTPLMNLVFFLLLPVIPAKACWLHLAEQSHEKRHAIVNEVLRYALLIGIVLLAALAGTHAVMAGDGALAEKIPAKIIWIWVAAALLILTCLILLAEHLHAFLMSRAPVRENARPKTEEPKLPY